MRRLFGNRAGRARGGRLSLRSALPVLAVLLAPGLAWRALDRAFPLPEAWLRPVSAGPAVLTREGVPLLRRTAEGGQWRMPVPLESVSPWAARAAIAAEDERFAVHPGVDPAAAFRAAFQNLRAGRIVSGASTITMQVCRMLEPKRRGWRAKAAEAFRAIQLERRLPKDRILEIYLNLAPYGGNLRGVEAASLAYFGKPSSGLSPGEAALLAGLPQSPSRLRPDRRPEAALARRAFVLERMVRTGALDPEQARAAAAEPAPGRLPLSPRAPAAAWMALARRPEGGRLALRADLQTAVESLAAAHLRNLPPGSDAAAVVLEIETGEIAALAGSADPEDPRDGWVNGALARRSPGSALKPFIFAAAMEAGRLDGATPILDGPVEFAGWTPENFDERFSGEITAGEALRRSLNIPAILAARAAGLSRCLGIIEAAGAPLPRDAAGRGGLAAVTGALETTLLGLTNAYATLGRDGVRIEPRLFADDPVRRTPVLSAPVCRSVSDILSTRWRSPPGSTGTGWFMWKTGTSAGRRDAWALGHNGRFAAGVWAGRFGGAARAEFTGATAAEPLLVRILSLPGIRREGPPPEAPPPPAGRPFALPAESGPRILSPSPGAAYEAVGGRAILRPRAAGTGRLTWFLDGKLLPPGAEARIEAPPGGHELRCADEKGRAAAARFTVR